MPKSIGARALRSKLQGFGMADHELDELVQLMRGHRHVGPGGDIVPAHETARHATIILGGVAAVQRRLEDGRRRIYSFHYPGDFCDLSHYALPGHDDAVGVQAITDCSVAIIDYKNIDALLSRTPTVGLALWRATMLDASISQHRSLNASTSALECVAHILCEQLALREKIGISTPILPLTQIDIADAAGLSVVHVNRVIQTLRGLDILSKQNHRVEVIDRKQLAEVARFDGLYLDMPQLLSNWVVKIDASPR
jgi:CRP-like cAMP-binding protein